MFERRLKILLLIFAIPILVLILRLVQLQAVQADDYQQREEKLLWRAPRYFPFVRGSITDRKGTVLAYDAPAWEIGVHYGVLCRDEGYLNKLQAYLADSQSSIEDEIDESWQAIAELSGQSLDDLSRESEKIVRRIRQVHDYLSKLHGRDWPIAEEAEDRVHLLVRGLNQQQMVEARQRLSGYPWIEVVPGYTRRYAGGEPVGHILGLLKEVDAEDIKNDSHRDDPLVCYESGDLKGVSGVEALGESVLRGRRGCEHVDRIGRPLNDPVESQAGQNFRLTLDLELQQYVFDRVMQAVTAQSVDFGGSVTGGSAVVLDIPTRQILALVSYPSFDPNLSEAERLLLAENDKQMRPDRFRAVREHYPPGSTVKPMVLACALQDGQICPSTRMFCDKYFKPGLVSRFRCMFAHGEVGPIDAVKRSCNIFFYHVGEWMGVGRLADWMLQFGLGRPSGIGMAEAGQNLPRTGWPGEARYMAIGQYGDITPLQAANMTATIASGEYRSVTLWMDNPDDRKTRRLPISQQYWQIVREGMYKVVNENGGTAYKYTSFQGDSEFVLLGKTGSSEVAGHEQTHAWFVGYLAPRRQYQSDIGPGDLRIALAVIIEYGGHGGEVAAPVAGDIVKFMVNRHRGVYESVTVGGMP